MKKLKLISCSIFSAKQQEKLMMFLRFNSFYLLCYGDFFIIESPIDNEVLHEQIYLHMGLAGTISELFITDIYEDEIEKNFPIQPDYDPERETYYGRNHHENIDMVLEKIQEFGMDFLTPFEKDILGMDEEK